MTSEVEAGERQYVSANAAAILTGFAGKILLGEQATNKQKATSYGKPNAPPLDGGSPGQSDGSGDLLPRLLLLDTVMSVGPGQDDGGLQGHAVQGAAGEARHVHRHPQHLAAGRRRTSPRSTAA